MKVDACWLFLQYGKYYIVLLKSPNAPGDNACSHFDVLINAFKSKHHDSFLQCATSGNITVIATNACGNSGLRTLPVSVVCRQSIIAGTIISTSKIFPNPTNGKVNIQFSLFQTADLSLLIFDITGRKLDHESIHATEGINIHELDLSAYSKGVYLIQLKGKDKNEMLKVTLE